MLMTNLKALSVAMILANSSFADEMTQQLPLEEIQFEVSHDDSFLDVMEFAASKLGRDTEIHVRIAGDTIVMKAGRKDEPRDYYSPLTKNEKADLTYILNTMARNSLASIATHRSSLKKAGERIDHLHPLRFLLAIFTDEELKADVNAIRGRHFVWKEFLSGITGSLETESKIKNLKSEYIRDFCKVLKIDEKKIAPLIKEEKWKDLVNVLIDIIPREGNPDRYDL